MRFIWPVSAVSVLMLFYFLSLTRLVEESFSFFSKSIDREAFSLINFFPPNAFLRRRRKKALLRVNDRGGG